MLRAYAERPPCSSARNRCAKEVAVVGLRIKTHRAVCGGCWDYNVPSRVRPTATRFIAEPSFRYLGLGFRLVTKLRV